MWNLFKHFPKMSQKYYEKAVWEWQEKIFNRFKILINSLIIIKYRCMISNFSKDVSRYDSRFE